CGNILIDGACLKCNSGAGNSFVYDPNPKSFNEVQSIFNPPSQPHYNIYLCQICESNSHYGYECVTPHIDHHCCCKCGDSLDGFFCRQCTCEFCGNGAHYGYNCPSYVPLIQTLPSFPQQYLCCEDYGGPHETFQSIAITVDLPTVEPEDSLRMGDEHLDTILEMKLDEFIKSSVEDLVPSLSESEDEHEYDVPACDDFTTFSNLLFDVDYDFSSVTIRIDKTDCDPEEEIRLIEKLLYVNSPPRPSDSLRDEINLFLTSDDSMPPGIEDDDYDSKRDMLILKELLSND
nr:hypothetical protein [Tanacetum cinerariifolium]